MRNTNVVVVTGGGTGIGRETAIHFAAAGANVVICGRRIEPLTDTACLIEKQNGIVLPISADVTDSSQVIAMVQTVLHRFGKIDVWVNNAGVIVVKPILKITEKEWDTILGVNLKGIFLCSKAVLPSMIERGAGIIINVSSTLGRTGIANYQAYCTSKFGVIGFTQSLAAEVRSNGVRVYAVCPGATLTEMYITLVGIEEAKSAMPPSKVAEAIFNLATGKTRLVSGDNLIVEQCLAQPSCFKLLLPVFHIFKKLSKLK